MLKKVRSRLKPYAVAVLAVCIALLLTWVLQPLLNPTIFMLFFAAVAVSAWYGGMEASILSIILSTLVVNYFLIEPKLSFLFHHPDSIIRSGLFVAVSILISSLNSQLRTAKERLELSMQHLQTSETRFSRLVESNILGVAVSDFYGGIHYANDYFLNMVGYTREELLAGGVRWDMMTPPEYVDLDQQAIAELLKNGTAKPFEKEYICKDGSRVPILVGIVLLQKPYNCQQEQIAFFLDLSERKRTEKALYQREAELSLITNAVPVLISYIDAQHCYRFNNKGYEELFGLTAAETSGKHIREVLGESVYQLIRPYIEVVMSGEQVTFENQVIDKHGRCHDVTTTYIPQFSQDGKAEGFVALVRDITDRKQAEQEREQLLEREQSARAEAEALNRIKDEFLGTLSHELRTPLNSMLGWTQLLRNRKFDASTTAKAMEIIDRNSRALAQLIDDVLDVSQIIRGELRLNLHQVELISVVETAIEIMRPAVDAKEIYLECQLDSAVGVVMGDTKRLQQVVWNLLANAVKFTAKGGRVCVQLERLDADVVQICVCDNGGGIATEFLPHVFERFRQADSSTTRSHGGLGLGLAIVRYLVELHGGTVSVASSGIGQGAKFRVTLPMKTVVVEESSNLN